MKADIAPKRPSCSVGKEARVAQGIELQSGRAQCHALGWPGARLPYRFCAGPSGELNQAHSDLERVFTSVVCGLFREYRRPTTGERRCRLKHAVSEQSGRFAVLANPCPLRFGAMREADAQTGPLKKSAFSPTCPRLYYYIYADKRRSGPRSWPPRWRSEDFGGAVLGRKIELVSGDHQNKADVRQPRTARRWVDN